MGRVYTTQHLCRVKLPAYEVTSVNLQLPWNLHLLVTQSEQHIASKFNDFNATLVCSREETDSVLPRPTCQNLNAYGMRMVFGSSF